MQKKTRLNPWIISNNVLRFTLTIRNLTDVSNMHQSFNNKHSIRRRAG